MAQHRGGRCEAALPVPVVETRLEPDLAIIACRISDPFSAPGSRVTARVTIENIGFTGSSVDQNEMSAVSLERPHDPVRVKVQLNPNPIDRDAANNSRECLFGAPAPAASLTWTNPVVYDEA